MREPLLLGLQHPHRGELQAIVLLPGQGPRRRGRGHQQQAEALVLRQQPGNLRTVRLQGQQRQRQQIPHKTGKQTNTNAIGLFFRANKAILPPRPVRPPAAPARTPASCPRTSAPAAATSSSSGTTRKRTSASPSAGVREKGNLPMLIFLHCSKKESLLHSTRDKKSDREVCEFIRVCCSFHWQS